MDGFATVVSPAGEEKVTLRLLLDLADKPRHVKIDNDVPGSYLVPEYLAEKYQATLSGSPDPVEEELGEESTEESTPAPKRRGRPPGSRNKTPQAADDKDGEE